MRRRQRRADAPAGHRVGLAGAIDDDGALEQVVGQIEQRGRRAGSVVDPAVDLVRDDPDLVGLGPLGDRPQLGQRVHGAGGIARRAEDEAAGQLVAGPVEVLGTDLEPPLEIAGHQHRLGPAEMHDLGIGHPGRRRDQHPVLGAEEREAGVEDRLLGARAHDDVVGVDGPAARHPAHVLRDRLPQLRDADVGRVAGQPLLDRLDAGLRGRRRRIEVRLADAQVEHILAGGLAALRLIADGDGLGGLEVLDVDRQRVGHAADPDRGVGVERRGKSQAPAGRCQPARPGDAWYPALPLP